MEKAKKLNSPSTQNQGSSTTVATLPTEELLPTDLFINSPPIDKSPNPFSKNNGNAKSKENLDDADEEMGDGGSSGEERKGRREIIPSVFSNSRNHAQEKSMLSYSQV